MKSPENKAIKPNSTPLDRKGNVPQDKSRKDRPKGGCCK